MAVVAQEIGREAQPSEAGAHGREKLAAGAAAGLVGAVLMALVLVAGAAREGLPPLDALRVLGATFLGEGALAAGSASPLYGAALHVLVAIGAGAIFATVIPHHYPYACAAAVGTGYAFAIMGVMTSTVLPLVNPAFRAAMQPIGGTWVIAHVVYGMALGLVPALLRRGAGRALRPTA